MDRRSEVVIAFLEFIVDPLLPSRYAAQHTPQLSKQHSLAQQVHSLVLLYNYYYRKHQYPSVPFMPFDEFCNLLLSLRPTLSAFMTFTKRSHENENENNDGVMFDAENKLSITEQKIKEACDICIHLDASRDAPSFGEWPITKVVVLLIDHWFEDCFMMFGSTTKGTWSLIEQELDNVNVYAADEEGLLQIAYSAVRKDAGIYREEDVMVLESYTAYSHSKEKAASRFYIMKYSWVFRTTNRIPVKDVIQRMKGDVVRESGSGGWFLIESAADYFHLLPYYQLISHWFSCLSTRVYPITTQPFRFPGRSAAPALPLSHLQIRDGPPPYLPSSTTVQAAEEEAVVISMSTNDHQDDQLVTEPPPPEVPAALQLANNVDDQDSSDTKEIRRMSSRKKTPNKRLAGYKLL